jgi:hypothetical protein
VTRRRPCPPVRKLVSEMNAEHQAWCDAQPAVTVCAWCDWTFEGSAGDGRDAFVAHRSEAHPDWKPRRVRKRLLPKGVIPMVPVKDPDAKAEGKERASSLAELHVRRGLEEEEAGAESTGEPSSSPSPRRSSRPSPLANPYGLAKAGRGHIWTKEAALQACQDFRARHGRPPQTRDLKVANGGQIPSLMTLRKLGWTLADYVEAAGYERPTRRTRYPSSLPRETTDGLEQAPDTVSAASPAVLQAAGPSDDSLAWVDELRAKAVGRSG